MLARVFLSGIIITAIVDRPDEPETYVREAVDIILRGLVIDPPQEA